VGKTLKDLILNTIFFYHPYDNFPKDFLINLFLRFQIYNSLNRTNKESQALRTDKKQKSSNSFKFINIEFKKKKQQLILIYFCFDCNFPVY